MKTKEQVERRRGSAAKIVAIGALLQEAGEQVLSAYDHSDYWIDKVEELEFEVSTYKDELASRNAENERLKAELAEAKLQTEDYPHAKLLINDLRAELIAEREKNAANQGADVAHVVFQGDTTVPVEEYERQQKQIRELCAELAAMRTNNVAFGTQLAPCFYFELAKHIEPHVTNGQAKDWLYQLQGNRNEFAGYYGRHTEVEIPNLKTELAAEREKVAALEKELATKSYELKTALEHLQRWKESEKWSSEQNAALTAQVAELEGLLPIPLINEKGLFTLQSGLTIGHDATIGLCRYYQNKADQQRKKERQQPS